jgi:CheY-like chemotaxis protein
MAYALVVDDNRATADALCSLLSVFGLQAEAAYGPRSALEMAGVRRPDVVFLDLNMPGVNGIEVLRFFKRDPALAEVPVIVVTSDDQPETREAVRRAGALDLIVKPPTAEAIESVLQRSGLA